MCVVVLWKKISLEISKANAGRNLLELQESAKTEFQANQTSHHSHEEAAAPDLIALGDLGPAKEGKTEQQNKQKAGSDRAENKGKERRRDLSRLGARQRGNCGGKETSSSGARMGAWQAAAMMIRLRGVLDDPQDIKRHLEEL
ncbi:hypothetical protein CRG98_042197 [Punica granatum]|uniref:Uncharacterized protein n=1 Tax=Punica granatum TaxID=22663 RepID=A0A2I0I0C2_PUNGR|nr:hypothetical protein CRG98_042197 [Punica granatum]